MDFMKNKIIEEAVGEKVSQFAGKYLGEERHAITTFIPHTHASCHYLTCIMSSPQYSSPPRMHHAITTHSYYHHNTHPPHTHPPYPQGDHIAVMAGKLALDASDGHIDMKSNYTMISQGVQNMVEGKPAKPEPPKPEGIMGFMDNLIHPNKENQGNNNNNNNSNNNHQSGEQNLLQSVMSATANGEGGALDLWELKDREERNSH
ncbi:hypothetical protein BC829DRAFT_420368 [Chytridium lagenaria]|nr:hypothetical protein BC829DRAFT_420368 [Chytridium lagenaria]